MRILALLSIAFLFTLAVVQEGCAQGLTPDQKQTVISLRNDLKRIQQDIDEATREDSGYSGGLIKALVGVRLEILKVNAALVEQRIHGIEGGARQNVVVNVTKPDLVRAEQLAKDIENQKEKVAESRREADQYSGGLVQALALTTAETGSQTLAMMEQQYFVAKYGLALPTSSEQAAQVPSSAPISVPAPVGPARADQSASGPGDCLKIATYDSSVLDTNDVYTELAWKVDVSNSCSQPYSVTVHFVIYDKDDFELDSDSESVMAPANGTGRARGKMLVSPPEKARRMAKQGASLSAS